MHAIVPTAAATVAAIAPVAMVAVSHRIGRRRCSCRCIGAVGRRRCCLRLHIGAIAVPCVLGWLRLGTDPSQEHRNLQVQPHTLAALMSGPHAGPAPELGAATAARAATAPAVALSAAAVGQARAAAETAPMHGPAPAPWKRLC